MQHQSPVGSIGRYQLLKLLGEGGMGQVWLAEQSTPVKRQVALKLIRNGIYDAAVARRFASEQQSLAIMEHPAIAKVFDAGSTPAGNPYFVMEYVPGLPITQYCDQKKLKIRERLELFIRVCEGVQHAHQKAIIHRDLKPSNILVTEIDGKPEPRIIDFGIAKAVQPDSDQTLLTRGGAPMGTPGYMSPEQADPAIADVDTRTDVYSLGVVLYELLVGAHPFDSGKWREATVRRSPAAIARRGSSQPKHQAQPGEGNFQCDRRDARHRARPTNDHPSRRSGLDHHEGAREGPGASLRHAIRVGG